MKNCLLTLLKLNKIGLIIIYDFSLMEILKASLRIDSFCILKL